MLDQWGKITAIMAAVVIIVSAVVAPSVGIIVWLARLDSDVNRLQDDVGQLQSDVKQLQSDVAELQEGQQNILDFLRRMADDNMEIEDRLAGHTHDADGRARLPLDRR